MLVSFPRDLVVDIPGHGQQQLNAAFAFGGPALVIRTLEADFAPLKINHYIGVDFRGFKSIVDAIGHVQIYFPTPANDEFTGLHQPQGGCASLNGDQALAYARSRHYNVPVDVHNPAPWQPYNVYSNGQVVDKLSHGWIEDPLSDLDRIPRQQYFLRTIGQFAINTSGDNPFKIKSLLDAVFKNFVHDDSLKESELKTLANTFKGLNPAKVDMQTLPWVAGTGALRNRVLVKNPEASQVIARLANFPPPQIPQPAPVETVKVRVVNGSHVTGAAAAALDALTRAGFTSAGAPEDADRSDYARTQIRYAPGKFFEGITVSQAIGSANLVQAVSPKATLGGEVLVIVGADYNRLKHDFDHLPHVASAKRHPGTTTTAKSGAVTPTTTGAPTTTTTTIAPSTTPDTRFVPVDPKTGGPLVGCPKR
jgi:LCP family protein required for cell wall assembly